MKQSETKFSSMIEFLFAFEKKVKLYSSYFDVSHVSLQFFTGWSKIRT